MVAQRSLSDEHILPALFDEVTRGLGDVKLSVEKKLSRPVNYTFLSLPQHFRDDRAVLKSNGRPENNTINIICGAAQKAGFWLADERHARTMLTSIYWAYRLDTCEGYGFHSGPCHYDDDYITVIVDYNDETLGLFMVEYSLGPRRIMLHSEYTRPPGARRADSAWLGDSSNSAIAG